MKMRYIVLLILTVLLASCSSKQDRLYTKLSKDDPKHMKYAGHFKVGGCYKIKGKKYTPEKKINYKEVGMASWYGSKGGFHGKKTANGDRYNKNVLSAAHKTLPMPSLVKVTNTHNNKSLIVMVNDRGPYARGRIIDVSEKAAKILGFRNQGVAKVKVEYLHKETQDFLKNISLNDKPGAKVKGKVKNPKCSVNCHVKLVNLKHKLAVNP